ncbi:Outer membrane protein A [Tepidimonas charontis]|uniref:Outer membrane protein A n=1 Tax=Tepidimonas charontis TaxID=2267262 RepID=A0A554WX42_9BURK|nr:Outer membrane protein A [Tepidimonas charontis]
MRARPTPAAARPAAPAPTPAPSAPQKFTFQGDALFDFDKAVLTPQGKSALDGLISKIKATNLEVVIAVGHTDSVGSDAYNDRLSLRRAGSVLTCVQNRLG